MAPERLAAYGPFHPGRASHPPDDTAIEEVDLSRAVMLLDYANDFSKVAWIVGTNDDSQFAWFTACVHTNLLFSRFVELTGWQVGLNLPGPKVAMPDRAVHRMRLRQS